MNLARSIGLGSVLAMMVLSGCGADSDGGPPNIRYGDSICVECGMIISDERFATATIIDGDRGNEPMTFDDFNCQMIFESKHTEFVIVDRWSHDHGSSEWISMADAWYVKSDQIRTPMASHIASFATEADAESFAEPIDGEVIRFAPLWKRD